MRILIFVSIFLVFIAACSCYYESHESSESRERGKPFVTARKANSFINRREKSRYYERMSEQYKSPYEKTREKCEDYIPCDNYAARYGYRAAIQHYFNKRKFE
ncbi:matrix Gla protein [Protopterus annectens]|uniref:matrix Gla protein n=1 Tax=Protopterus annectens TaxID=7888 RepID=UPI001CFAC802|nr:matrix Gla protein [Protopterus annectens]